MRTFVADLRAPTPSGAAELAVPDRAEYALNLRTLDTRLHAAAHKQIQQKQRTLDALQQRLEARNPTRYIEEKRVLLDRTADRLFAAFPAYLAREEQKLSLLRRRLLAAGRDGVQRPPSTLCKDGRHARRDQSAARTRARLCRCKQRCARGAVITDAAMLKAGDALHIRFAKGAVNCRVTDIEEEKNNGGKDI